MSLKTWNALPLLFLVLLIGSFSCSKKEFLEPSAAPAPTGDQISIVGNWTAGQLSNTKKAPADTSESVTSTTQMAASVWTFKQDGTLTVGDGSSAASISFTTLPHNMLVLTIDREADTLSMGSVGINKILLTGIKNVNGYTMTEVLELHRTSY